MAESPATNPNPVSGAMSSATGWFADVVKTLTPVAQTYLQFRTAKEGAKASYTDNAGAGSGTGSDWRGTVNNGASITSAPWFPYAIGGGVLLLLGVGFFALRGGKK